MVSNTIKYTFIFFILCLLLPASAFDLTAYTVALENFNERVFTENETVYRLESAFENFTLKNTPFQGVIANKTRGNNKLVYLRVGNISGTGSITPEEKTRSCINTRYLSYDDPRISRISEKIQNEKNSILAAEKFVYGHITDKNMGIPLLKAPQIFDNRAGDCTEHTVLAVSILRGAGIPARAVVGMVLSDNFQGKKNVFVYHMWAEAFYKNKWQLVDPSFPGEKHENRYIAFACHSLQTEMPLSYLTAINKIKKFKVYYESGK